ncbi:dynein regulatory complex protein 8 [Danio rerio]|uniref:Dynein regulatory complex protein 8 n=1 Tax=Danio rerio TaxID=7955 RepID=A0A8M1P370_DANRE|nr:dynein regulatory complex protein 8 [Danio rerio]|eukprot:NP_001314837.1 EF-hand calcium-binding domain-containing protein 2 [Danio rerio]
MADKYNAENIIIETQKRIGNAFDVFDHESNKTVDVREIGTIIRSLGCFPSEAELHDIISELEEEEPTGFVRYEKFLPTMTKILLERKFRPITEDLLIQAFEVLDQQKKGHLEPAELAKYLTQEGEPFTQEEMDEMLSAAVDPDKNVIFYKDFVSMMTYDDTR